MTQETVTISRNDLAILLDIADIEDAPESHCEAFERCVEILKRRTLVKLAEARNAIAKAKGINE